jgi:hypothetical protein
MGENHKKCEKRGGMDYHFPRGWFGYALKVKDQYDNGNNDWIDKWDESGYCVAYHGFMNEKDGKGPINAINFILNNKLKPGGRQQYKYSKNWNSISNKTYKTVG